VERDSRHYDFGAVDWAELDAVIKGNGPCNAQRMAQRKAAHDDGAWVREAATAHASKAAALAEAHDDRLAAVRGVPARQAGADHVHVGSLHARRRAMALHTRATCTPAATKVSASGSWRRPISPPPARMRRIPSSCRPATRSIAIHLLQDPGDVPHM